MDQRKYYEAYDERYKIAHSRNIRWMSDRHSAIVSEVIEKYRIGKDMPILELGCGEGRDAQVLLENGYNLLATDISPEGIRYCKERCPDHADRFRILDCVLGSLDGKFDFIYAVAVIHMLLLNEDRDKCYRFVREHLTQDGIGLICTMGDGNTERRSDISTAFELQERECNGQTVWVTGTSCRMVSFQTFTEELARNHLEIVERGITCVEPDFPKMMYAVVRKGIDP